MGLLIFAGLTFLFSLAALKKQSRLLLFLLQFHTFLFVFFFFWVTRDNYQIVQIKKLGYQLEKVTDNFREPARKIAIGGDPAKDDIYIDDLPPRAVQIIPAVAANQVELHLQTDGLLATSGQFPLNAVTLKNGDRIACGANQLVFTAKGAFQRSFTYQNKAWEWPRKSWRIQKVREPFLSSSFSSRLYPIADIARDLGFPCDSKAAFSMQQLRITATRNPVQMNAVVLIGAGNGVQRNGAPVPNRFTLSDTDILRLYSIDSTEDTVRLQSATSFKIRNGETLDLLLPVPQVMGIKEDLLRNGSAVNKPLFLSTSTLPYSVFPTAHYARESKKFSGLFAFVQTQDYTRSPDLWNLIEQKLQNVFLITPDNLEVVTDQGSFRPAYGSPFVLGRNDKMIFAIDKVDFPWVLLQTLLILWIAKMLFQPPFFAAIEHVGLQLLVITADFFLITRFLFSFRASNLYPFSSEALGLSLYAILIVPYLIFSGALLMRASWERRHAFNFLTYSAIVSILAAVILQSFTWLTLGVVAIFTLIAFLRFHPRSFASHLISRNDSFRNLSAEVLLGMFALGAFLLQALGAGEAIHAFGIRFPLALIYHPLLIFFSCYYINRIHAGLHAEKDPQTLRNVWREVLKLGLVLLCFIFISLLTADFGFLLLYSVPVLFVLFGVAIRYVREYELSWKGAGMLMAAPLGLFLILFAGSSLMDRLLPVSALGNRTIQRILLTVDPGILQESGLVAAERQLGHQRTFVAYSHSGLFGGGYMNRPITSAIAGTALNDNVPAAFLLNDFGALGFLGVCLILYLWAVLWWKSDASLNFSTFVSLTALVTFIYVDLYMMLSNCGIFLFTGKNFFFWGLNSVSDIFHSSLLLFLVAVFGTRIAMKTAGAELRVAHE